MAKGDPIADAGGTGDARGSGAKGDKLRAWVKSHEGAVAAAGIGAAIGLYELMKKGSGSTSTGSTSSTGTTTPIVYTGTGSTSDLSGLQNELNSLGDHLNETVNGLRSLRAQDTALSKKVTQLQHKRPVRAKAKK